MIDRIKRLETLFLEEINTLITKMAANGDFGGFVTITAVRLSKDLASAKVFFSVFGSPEDKIKTQNALSILRKEIGAKLRGRLHLKRIPSFSFEFDDTPEKASRVESIFQVIEKENTMQNREESLRRIWKALRAGNKFFIAGHLNPDGDSLGCTLAVTSLLERLGKTVYAYAAPAIGNDLKFLPGLEKSTWAYCRSTRILTPSSCWNVPTASAGATWKACSPGPKRL